MALIKIPGFAAIELWVDMPVLPEDPQSGTMINGLRSLLEKNELCDVVLVASTQAFWAHRLVLAAATPKFHECFMQLDADPIAGAAAAALAATVARVPVPAGVTVLSLDGITHPEAVKIMIDCVYEVSREYKPSSAGVNRDVLSLARRFEIPQMLEAAARWLVEGLSTTNLLDRVMVCEEFKLIEVRETILQQLVANPESLFMMVRDPDITKVPFVMQDLLVRILTLLGADKAGVIVAEKPQGKQAKKAIA